MKKLLFVFLLITSVPGWSQEIPIPIEIQSLEATRDSLLVMMANPVMKNKTALNRQQIRNNIMWINYQIEQWEKGSNKPFVYVERYGRHTGMMEKHQWQDQRIGLETIGCVGIDTIMYVPAPITAEGFLDWQTKIQMDYYFNQ